MDLLPKIYASDILFIFTVFPYIKPYLKSSNGHMLKINRPMLKLICHLIIQKSGNAASLNMGHSENAASFGSKIYHILYMFSLYFWSKNDFAQQRLREVFFFNSKI